MGIFFLENKMWKYLGHFWKILLLAKMAWIQAHTIMSGWRIPYHWEAIQRNHTLKKYHVISKCQPVIKSFQNYGHTRKLFSTQLLELHPDNGFWSYGLSLSRSFEIAPRSWQLGLFQQVNLCKYKLHYVYLVLIAQKNHYLKCSKAFCLQRAAISSKFYPICQNFLVQLKN